jgi:hypothetical protein
MRVRCLSLIFNLRRPSREGLFYWTRTRGISRNGVPQTCGVYMSAIGGARSLGVGSGESGDGSAGMPRAHACGTPAKNAYLRHPRQERMPAAPPPRAHACGTPCFHPSQQPSGCRRYVRPGGHVCEGRDERSRWECWGMVEIKRRHAKNACLRHPILELPAEPIQERIPAAPHPRGPACGTPSIDHALI